VKPKKRKLKLEMPKDPSGTYANMVMLSHNQNEMFFDFIQMIPHDARARVQERIVMTPTHAKMFLQALQTNMSRFEARFGEVEVPQRPQSFADQLFSGVQPTDDDDDEKDNDEQPE